MYNNLAVIKIKRLVILILIPLCLLLTIQICLKNPETRELFTDIEEKENINYSKNVPDAKTRIKITVTDGSAVDAFVLYNGREICRITDDFAEFVVNCNGILEIKNNSGVPFWATAEICENTGEIIINNFYFTKGIKVLCTVSV